MPAESGRLTIQSIDGNKVPKSTVYDYITGSGLLADMLSFAAALIPLHDKVIQGQVTAAQLTVLLPLPGGLKAAPVNGSNNTIGALLDYDTVVPTEEASFWVPSWIPAGFQTAHQNLVDTAQADVVNWLNFMLATTNTTQLTDEDSNVLSALTKAVKSDRKQRRALGRVR